MISCDHYDYIEIVCMYRYPSKLTLKSGETIEAVALDTKRNDIKEECIEVDGEDSETSLIVLDDITRLEVCVDNPHFTEIAF